MRFGRRRTANGSRASEIARWLALLLACGLRRHEFAKLSFDHLQQREGHWAIVDCVGRRVTFEQFPFPTGCMAYWTSGLRLPELALGTFSGG
jgi:hypothetical protein